MSEGCDTQYFKALPNQDIILTYYMISVWCSHLLSGLGHYAIRPGYIAQVMVMTTNPMYLGYRYARHRIKNPPNIIFTLTHFGQINECTPSSLAWYQNLRGRDQALNRISPATVLVGIEDQEGLAAFDISIWITL